MPNDPTIERPAVLRRRLGLPLLVVYATGITIGAGIYLLIGAVAGHAEAYAPWSIVFAGMLETTKDGNTIGDSGAIGFVLD